MNQLITQTSELISWRAKLPKDKSVGLVPTMGNLHEGHASLIRASLAQNDFTIVTIFVNPKQFGPNEDFASYPRTLEADRTLIAAIQDHGVIIFAPASPSEIYPAAYSTSISVTGRLTEVLCGAKRPGHFEGVTTVVYQLFMLAQAQRAYFGLKDYQQLQVIKKMTTDLRLPIEIVPMPITRDENGLALSSRNQYLDETERKQALELSQALRELAQAWRTGGSAAAFAARQKLLDQAQTWDYLEILDGDDLTAPTKSSRIILFAGARYFGRARLIDNLTQENSFAR